MFDMGFIPDLRWMMRRMPEKAERLTMLFSATLNSRVKQLAWEHMNDPAEIEIEPDSITVEEIDQVLYHVSKDEKVKLLLGILKKEKPENAVIFINTKQHAVELSKRLNHNGYKSSCLMGDLPQKKRLSIIDKMKAGEIKLLVATDVAARGLHINDLEMVINYDLPEDCENYVHRIGRTARAGKSGRAVSLACEKYVLGLPAIEEYIKMKIPVEWADEELYAVDESEGMRFRQERRGPSDRTGGRSGQGRGRRPNSYGSRNSGGDGRRREYSRKPAERQNSAAKRHDSGNFRQEHKRYNENEKVSASSVQNKSHEKDNSYRNRNTGSPKRNYRDGRSNSNSRGRNAEVSVNNNRQGRQQYSKSKSMSYEERVKYYNEKYGENIAVPENKKICSSKT